VNLRLLACIVMGVFTAHIGVFMLIAQLKPKPKLIAPPKPNFSSKETVVVNAETGEKTVFREITVSTMLAPSAGTPPPVKPIPPEIKPEDVIVNQE
jgi:hypothetical protein